MAPHTAVMLDGLGHFVNSGTCPLSGGDEVKVVQTEIKRSPGCKLPAAASSPARCPMKHKAGKRAPLARRPHPAARRNRTLANPPEVPGLTGVENPNVRGEVGQSGRATHLRKKWDLRLWSRKHMPFTEIIPPDRHQLRLTGHARRSPRRHQSGERTENGAVVEANTPGNCIDNTRPAHLRQTAPATTPLDLPFGFLSVLRRPSAKLH